MPQLVKVDKKGHVSVGGFVAEGGGLGRQASLESYVLTQLLQTVAVLWKCGWAAEAAAAKEAFFAQAGALAQSQDRGQQLVAARLLFAVLSEFSATKSTAIGVPVEFHHMAHQGLQRHGLKEVLGLGVGMLGVLLQENVVSE